MTKKESAKTTAGVAERYPQIFSIQHSIEDVEAALVELHFSRWNPIDPEFALLAEKVLQLRNEVFELIDVVEPLVTIGKSADVVATAALKIIGAALGKLEQLIDDMSISIRRETIESIIGVDPQFDHIQQVFDELERIVTVTNAIEEANELSLTIESFFQETIDWLEGIQIMFEEKTEKLTEPIAFLKTQLDGEYSPAEKAQLLSEIDRITTLVTLYEKGLQLIQELYDHLRKKQRYYENDYRESSQYDDDDDYPDDDDWYSW